MTLPEELFDFLQELQENNNRPWFQANKDCYEKYYKEPLLAFISGFADRLPQISPYFTAIPKMTGGSLFRIYRDMRFSADKRPYKTWAGMQFRHERAPDVHSPGFYLHLEPGSCFVSCGIWKPESRTLQRVRQVISEHPQRWLDAINAPDFKSTYQLAGDVLRRPPRGFDPNHPLIEDLKRKDFLASHPISEKTVLKDDFLDIYTDLCLKSTPFMSFLTNSIGLDW